VFSFVYWNDGHEIHFLLTSLKKEFISHM
jgi:hypothetical protein